MALFAGNREQSTREGLAIAEELIDAALVHFHGIYLVTPFMRYDMTVHLTEYINSKVKAIEHEAVAAREDQIHEQPRRAGPSPTSGRT